MSAMGLPNGKDFILSGYADYRHDALVFPRQQSPAFRDLEWEDRVRPLRSWCALFGLCATGLFLLVLAVMLLSA